MTLIRLQIGIFNYDQVFLLSFSLPSLIVSSSSSSAVMPLEMNRVSSSPPGSEWKHAPGWTPLRLLRRLHDVCAPQPAAVGDPGGLQPGAEAPSGNSQGSSHSVINTHYEY